MEDLGFNIIEIEKHDTTDIISKNINGELTVIWRDWDNIIKEPKMIYTTAVNPGETKYLTYIVNEQVILFVCKVKWYSLLKIKMGNIMKLNLHRKMQKWFVYLMEQHLHMLIFQKNLQQF